MSFFQRMKDKSKKVNWKKVGVGIGKVAIGAGAAIGAGFAARKYIESRGNPEQRARDAEEARSTQHNRAALRRAFHRDKASQRRGS